jgi:hypothetical protein
MVKRVIRQLNFAEAKKLVEHALTLSCAEEIEAVVREHAKRYLSDLDELLSPSGS